MRPADLKALESSATPGPWEFAVEFRTNPGNPWGNIQKPPPEAAHIAGSAYRDNGKFIAALRNLSPELIALWEACDVLVNPPPDCPGTDLAQLAVVRDCLNWLNAKAETL